jgi:gliding-associated putative ABC transporter substrate-binding component GldG
MDLQCDVIPLRVGGTDENPQLEFVRWNYFGLFEPGQSPAVNQNLGYVASRFANSIDTIQVKGVTKTAILVSSANSRIIKTPALISLNENKNAPQDERFKQSAIPVGVLLEGKFSSLYQNRLSQAQRDSLAAQGSPFVEASVDNKVIVVADGDILLNDWLPTPEGGPIPLPMGFNKYTYREYQMQTQNSRLFIPVANREFLLNAVEYLVNNAAIMETRNKEIVLRLLDATKIKAQRTTWQFINIALPVLLVLFFGFIYQQLRKRRYVS